MLANYAIMEGTILSVKNVYHVKLPTEATPVRLERTDLLSSLLPGDTIRVEGSRAIALVDRAPQTTIAIVRGLVGGRVYLVCPLLTAFFNPSIMDSSAKLGDRFLVRIDKEGTHPLARLPPLSDRKGDAATVQALWNAVAPFSPPKTLKANAPLYTHPFQSLVHLPTFSIDPCGSKDADDAITVLPEERRILVHIVDIHSHLLTEDPDLYEKQMATHAFTLYLPEGNQHILPTPFAEYEFALAPGEVRRVITVDIVFTEKGSVESYKIYPSVIQNKHALTYEQALSVIAHGEAPFPFLMKLLGQNGRKTLEIPTVRFALDGSGNAAGHWLETNTDPAHKIIEMLMVLANMIVSQHLSLHPQTKETYRAIPQRFHSQLRVLPTDGDPTGDPVVNSFLAIKGYAAARYDALLSGHFGLQLTSYTHFTSPIRRAFDVIIHHLLAGMVYDTAELQAYLEHINRRERLMEQCQRLYMQWKLLGSLREGDELEGIVTRVHPAGFHYLVRSCMLDGFLVEHDCARAVGSPVRIRVQTLQLATCQLKCVLANDS